MDKRSIALALLARSAVHGGLALSLALTRGIGWGAVFTETSYAAIIDGVLGLVIAGLLIDDRPVLANQSVLAAVTLGDAIVRIVVGAAILTLPGIPYIPFAAVIVFAIVAMSAVCLGLAALLIDFEDLRLHAHRWPLTSPWSRAAILGVGALAIGLGWLLTWNPPAVISTLRGFVAAGASLFSLVFAVAAAGAWSQVGRRATADACPAAR